MRTLSVFLFMFFFLFSFNSYSQEFSAKIDKNYVPGISNTDQEIEIHYDGENYSGVGAAGATFIVAARFTPDLLSPYVGKGLTKLRVYVRDATVGNTGTVKVYGQGTATTPGTQLYSAATPLVANSWNTIVLSPFVPINGQDLWIGVEAIAGPTGFQFWAGSDQATSSANGQFIYISGSWTTLAAVTNPPLGYNWNLRGIVDTNVPVELGSFTGNCVDGIVTLNWSTATELNNRGFEIERKGVNSEFITIGFVNGKGTTTETVNYSYSDQITSNGMFIYRLKQLDFNGNFEYSNEINVDAAAPVEFALNQNYPNPFNPSTVISFNLAVDSKISVKVFNVLGQEVSSLFNGSMTAGSHEINLNLSGSNSGIYFYQLEAAGIDGSSFKSVRKMTLSK